MAIITLPTDFAFDAAGFSFLSFNYGESSDVTGESAERLGGPPRWATQLRSLDKLTIAEAGRWQALMMKLRGSVNHLAVFDPVRTYPEGTMRGTPTLDVSVSAGATSLVLVATGTLKAGDLLQIGTGVGTSQLISVMDDATAAAGKITVTFEGPLRYGFTAGTAVTWDHPRFYGKMRGSQPTWNYEKGMRGAGGFQLDIVEAW